MGVLNVTPDSFSDGGCFLDPALAERRALTLQDEGAHFLDVGGESSRPGSRPVTSREEIRRILPVLKRFSKKIKIPISIDTHKYDVALSALEHGASIVNDITALSGDRRMAKLIARYRASVVLMHMQGKPSTMQKKPSYRDVVTVVKKYLLTAVQKALEAGIPGDRVMVDPGFGFGKSTEHNLELLSRLDELSSLQQPLLVGLSRKSFLGQLLGISGEDWAIRSPDRRAAIKRSWPGDEGAIRSPDRRAAIKRSWPAEKRLVASLAAASVAIQRGAHVLRVHDVSAHRQLVALVDRAQLLRK